MYIYISLGTAALHVFRFPQSYERERAMPFPFSIMQQEQHCHA